MRTLIGRYKNLGRFHYLNNVDPRLGRLIALIYQNPAHPEDGVPARTTIRIDITIRRNHE